MDEENVKTDETTKDNAINYEAEMQALKDMLSKVEKERDQAVKERDQANSQIINMSLNSTSADEEDEFAEMLKNI